MKKYLIAIVVIAAFAAYVIFSRGSAPTDNNGTDIAVNDGGTPTTTPTSTPTSSGPGPLPEPKPIGQYKDGKYTGPVSDAFYGNLQVVAVISGGKLTDIQFPVSPNDPGETTLVSQSSLPKLKQEAIAAQSANVNIVSGATQTSEAFQQSLAAALNKAKS